MTSPDLHALRSCIQTEHSTPSFGELTGYSPMEYLRRLRIERRARAACRSFAQHQRGRRAQVSRIPTTSAAFSPASTASPHRLSRSLDRKNVQRIVVLPMAICVVVG